MKITIKTLQGKPIDIEVTEQNTVQELKDMIFAQLKVEPEFQKLIHFGKVLQENGKKLGECGVKDKEFLVLMLTKKGPEKKDIPEPKPAELKPTVEPKPVSPENKQEKQQIPAVSVSVRPAAPAVPAVPQQVRRTSAEESYLTGGDYESAITNLMDMGFPRDQVVRAMGAAYNNPDRATDYLLNGIPSGAVGLPGPSRAHEAEIAIQPSVRPSAVPPAAPSAPSEVRAKILPADIYGVPLAGSGDLETLRSRILNDPTALQAALIELQTINPMMYHLISQNPTVMMDLLLKKSSGSTAAPVRGPAPAPARAAGPSARTPAEQGAIDRLKGLGFSEAQAIQAYEACGKNEELAANFMFENMEAFRDQNEAASPGVHPPGANIFPLRPAVQTPPLSPIIEAKKEEKKDGQKDDGSNLSPDPKPMDKP